MPSRKSQDAPRDPRDLIGHEPITPENLHERIAAMLDRAEALGDPWAAGASMGILAGLRGSGVLSDADHALHEAEHAVRVGKGWRWLDRVKAALGDRRS